VKRLEVIAILGGAAVTWPLASRAQQPQAVRKLGVLMIGAENDPDSKLRIAAFEQGLRDLGWQDGRNLRIDLGIVQQRRPADSRRHILDERRSFFDQFRSDETEAGDVAARARQTVD